MDKVASAREEFPALTAWLFFGSAGIGPLPRGALSAMRKETEALLVDFDRRAWEEDVRAEARSLAPRPGSTFSPGPSRGGEGTALS
jgi:hypothetical protein